jgi:hypothetical protein
VLEFEPDIVHFCGHGEGHEGVVFEDEVGKARLVSTDALSGFFELFADKVECVVLNACYSEVQAKAIAQSIRYVIGMKRAIGDDAAIEFAVAFYDALGAGKSIEFAYKLACNAIEWAGLPEAQIPILESETPFKRNLSQVWSVPHHRNPNFIGRDRLLDEIRASFSSSQTTTVVQALRGLGGVGKTQLAVEYAYRYAHEYSYVWWVRAENESTIDDITFKPAIMTDYVSFGKAIGLPVESVTDQWEAVRIIREWLEHNTGWLLVFDNATDADSLRRFLPQAATGHTIITSRNPSWKGLALTLKIGVLEGEESVRLILQATGQSDTDAAGELAYALGDLPLALSQATAYIEKTGISLAEYLEIFRSRRTELQQREAPPEDYPYTVAITWLINVQIINRQMAEAVELLNLISFLGPDAIPLSLLKYNLSLLPGSLSGLMKDDLRINDAIAALRSYSLVESFGQAISLHRLVQAITRDNLSKIEFQRWATAAIQIVRASFPKNSDKIETRDVCARLLPHALASAGHASKHNLEPKATSWLYNQVGLHLILIGDFESAESILRRALDIAEGKIGDTEHDRSR